MRRSNGPDTSASLWARTGLFACVLVVSFLLIQSSWAQREAGAVNVGLQVGRPGGVTGKVYRSTQTAYDILLTTDGDDFVTLTLHRLREYPLPDSMVYAYGGPGIVVGGRSLDTTPLPELSVSIQVGLNFYERRFEVFLHATPTLRLLPNIAPLLRGSVGLRYTLQQP